MASPDETPPPFEALPDEVKCIIVKEGGLDYRNTYAVVVASERWRDTADLLQVDSTKAVPTDIAAAHEATCAARLCNVMPGSSWTTPGPPLSVAHFLAIKTEPVLSSLRRLANLENEVHSLARWFSEHRTDLDQVYLKYDSDNPRASLFNRVHAGEALVVRTVWRLMHNVEVHKIWYTHSRYIRKMDIENDELPVMRDLIELLYLEYCRLQRRQLAGEPDSLLVALFADRGLEGRSANRVPGPSRQRGEASEPAHSAFEPLRRVLMLGTWAHGLYAYIRTLIMEDIMRLPAQDRVSLAVMRNVLAKRAQRLEELVHGSDGELSQSEV